MQDTKIRWAGSTWNVMTGCTEVSPGCDNCYAKVIAEKFRGGAAFPNGFDPQWRPHRLDEPRKWARSPRRVFVNSMSDLFHPDFTDEQREEMFATMDEYAMHDYLILTKRPQRMADYMLRRMDVLGQDKPGDHLWLGTSIESDRYTFRADHLRRIPGAVRFISAEPLIEAVPSLDLTGIAWVICGGESGNGTRNFRPMPHEWATDLRDATHAVGAAYYFKQSAAVKTERGTLLNEAEKWEEYPLPHPAREDRPGAALGRYTDGPVPLAQGVLL